MAKRKKAGTQPTWQADLADFFAAPLAEKAGSYLSERTRIAIHIDGESFLYSRVDGRNVITASDKPDADVHFWVMPSAMRHLLGLGCLPGTGLGTLGVAVLEHLFASDPERKIKFRVDAGFLNLWSKGYFSVLKAGGPEVASYVAQKGFNSVARIKEVLKNIRG
jgi:hypothetical protein